MALGSRIESESTRRVVLALIMLGVLAMTVSAAMLLSRSRQTYRRPPLERLQTPLLSMVVPDWDRLEIREHPPSRLTPLAGFIEPSRNQRQLWIYQFNIDTAVAPDTVLRDAEVWLTKDSRIAAGAAVRSSTMLTRIIYGDALGVDGSLQKLVLSASTVDGRTYFVAHLSGPGPVVPDDLTLLRRIAESMEHRGFEVETGDLRVGSVDVKLAKGMRALRRKDRGDDDPLVITPTKTGDFRLLKIGHEPLRDVDKLRQARGPGAMPDQLTTLVQSSAAGSADARLIALLAVRYWQATGKMPPPRSMQPFKVDDRVALAMRLSGENAAAYRALWAVRIAGDQAVILQLVCEASRTGEVIKDAALVLHGMGLQPEAPEPPAAAPAPAEDPGK